MIGSQEPRIRVEPDRVRTDGEEAALLMQEYGNNPDEWQRLVLNCWLGKDKSGKYTMTSGGLAVPRQNGKNVCLEGREFYGMCINGEKILHTAHQVKTAKKSFNRLVQMFTDKRHPDVMSIVKQIRFTNGEEAIILDNGGSVEFCARSRQGARGFDGISVVVFDEAQELTDEQVEAIMATLAASATGTRQVIYTGTPPYPNCPGDVFRRRRTTCINNPGKHDAWHEWSVEGKSIQDINVADKQLWFMTNPAMGIHLTAEFTEEELRSMTPDGFARERLGWWSPILTEATEYVLDPKKWDKCVSDALKPERGKTAYGVKFSPDGSVVCLAGAIIPENGQARISLIKEQLTAQGIRWLSDWLIARHNKASCVVIDGKNGVDVLVDRISDTWKEKDSIIRCNVKIILAATSLIVDSVNEQSLTWYRGQEELNQSARNSVKRAIGGGFGFGGDNSTPIEACALAFWGAKNSKRDPNKKMRIG